MRLVMQRCGVALAVLLLWGATLGADEAASFAPASAAPAPFSPRFERLLAAAQRPGRLRLGIFEPYLGPPPAPPGTFLRFESTIDVQGRIPFDFKSALAQHLQGFDAHYGPTEGAPTRTDLGDHRPHPTQGADFVPLAKRLFRVLRRK